MLFNSIVGHSRQLNLIRNLVEEGRFPRSSLFVGPEGVGKRTVAEELFSHLCGGSFNVRVLGVEKPVTVDEVREASTWLFTKPTSGSGKAVIIDRADEMRGEAANALLKTLEEPPDYAYLCLVGKSEEAVIPTIRSRCRTFRFGPLPDSSVSYLLEKMGLTADKRVVKLSRGSIGVALKLLETPIVDLIDELAALLKDRERLKKVVPFSEKFGKLSRDEALLFFDAFEAVVFEKGGAPRWEEAINRARYYLKFYGKPRSVMEWFLISVLGL